VEAVQVDKLTIQSKFVWASVSKLTFAFGFVARFFRCPIGAGAGSFFRLCCCVGLGSNAVVNAEDLQPPVTLVRYVLERS